MIFADVLKDSGTVGLALLMIGGSFATNAVLKFLDHARGGGNGNSKAEQAAALAQAGAEAVWRASILTLTTQQMALLDKMHEAVRVMVVQQERHLELSGEIKKDVAENHRILERRWVTRREEDGS